MNLHYTILSGLRPPVPSSLPGPNILLTPVFSDTSSQCSALTVRRSTFPSHATWQAESPTPSFKKGSCGTVGVQVRILHLQPVLLSLDIWRRASSSRLSMFFKIQLLPIYRVDKSYFLYSQLPFNCESRLLQLLCEEAHVVVATSWWQGL
jgi:hypothetical protein